MDKLLQSIARRCVGGQFPKSYVVFDTETSGTDPVKDKILQYGLAIVREGKLVDTFSILVNRTDVQISPGAQAVHGISNEKMAAEGCDPQQAFEEMLQTFEAYRKAGQMFVGHNIIAFDAPLFEQEARVRGVSFKFGDNEILDTGTIVKAAQLGMYIDDRDSIRSWARKVTEVRRKGLYWSLDRYCFDTFKLAEFGLRKDEAHDAGYDCKLTHYLFRRFEEKLNGVRNG